MKIIISILLIILFISGCFSLQDMLNPDKFVLNKGTIYAIDGLEVSELGTVEKIKENEILLHRGGIASLKNPNLTQSNMDFTVNIKEGEGLKMAFRTVLNNYPYNQAIYFDFSTKGCKVLENQNLISSVDSIKAELLHSSRIRIKNDGSVYTILVDCDTVIQTKTNLPTTEFLILNSGNSEVDISGYNVTYIIDHADFNVSKEIFNYK